VYFVVRNSTSEQERVILTTLYLADAKNTDSWRTKKGSLQRVFLLDDLMVPSSALVVAADSERLSCDVSPSAKPFTSGASSSSPTASVA
jgi:hypothetical protein